MAQPIKNFLIDAYAKQGGSSIHARLEPVALPFKTVLFRAGERPQHVHFVTSGLASIVLVLEEGAEVEVAMHGQEGCPESVHLLGPELAPRTCMMQVEGTALRMPFAECNKLFLEDALFRRLILHLVQNQTLMSSQFVACNGRHDAEQRLARWLLMVQDRVGDPDLPLTQEFLSQMLGARRSTVTISASNLQRAGMIDYRRGRIRILDRERLAETACECYGIVHRLFANLRRDDLTD